MLRDNRRRKLKGEDDVGMVCGSEYWWEDGDCCWLACSACVRFPIYFSIILNIFEIEEDYKIWQKPTIQTYASILNLIRL